MYKIRKTKKAGRKGPTVSATKFSVGTKKRGNDGNMWVIIATLSGTHRWKKITGTTFKKHKKVSIKATTKKSTDISIKTLKQLKKKYEVSVSGSKKEMAAGLWRVRRSAISAKDLALIIHLLPKKEQKDVEKLLNTRNNDPITNYKGMWKPLPKPLSKMSREELVSNLRSFRDAWERITTRNQDLGNERLASDTTEELRSLLKFYYSNGAKLIAEDWLRK